MKYAEARLVAEWAADETLLGRGFAVYACYNRGTEFLLVKSDLPADDPTFPSINKKYVSAWRFERQMKSLMGVAPIGPSRSPPLDQARGLARQHLAAAQELRPHAQDGAGQGGLPLDQGRGGRGLRDPGRAGPCRDHRAGALPLPGGRRGDPQPGGAARLRPQGDREALRSRSPGRRGRGWRGGSPATPPWPMPSATAGRSRP